MIELPHTLERYREVSLELELWAVRARGPRDVTARVRLGDERFALVTEGRDHGSDYSCCADLGHWLHMRLGIHMPWVNRKEHHGWKDVVNVSRLAWCSAARAPHPDETPAPGDIWIIWSHPTSRDAHVTLPLQAEGSDLWTVDYGQASLGAAWHAEQAEGALRHRHIVRNGVHTIVDGRTLHRVIPLADALEHAARAAQLAMHYELPAEPQEPQELDTLPPDDGNEILEAADTDEA